MAHQKQLKRTETAFCLCLVNDHSLLKELGVILVSNIADEEVRRRLEAAQTLFSTEGLHDKPAGWGLPGGGGGGGLESAAEIALKELGEETGLSEKPGTKPKPLGRPLHRTGRVDKKGAIVRMSRFFDDGQEPAIRLNRKERETTNKEGNVLYVFSVDVVWEGTELQARLRSVKEQLLEGGWSMEEDIQCDGVWVNFSELTSELSPEAIAKLGIKIGEIDGIGVFPISLFVSAEGPDDFRVPIYLSHLKYAKDGLRELGLLPKAEKETPEVEATI
jgi:8-oxo-dGTP pyrophosphatase MutT (NUDIX family)